MFFSVGTNPDTRFSIHHHVGKQVVSCDSGWERFGSRNGIILAKGYADNLTLASLAAGFDSADLQNGNFTLIRILDNVEIKHNRHRGYPLYQTDKGITNLKGTDDIIRNIWANEQVSLVNDEVVVTSGLEDFKIENSISYDTAVELCASILNTSISSYYYTNKPQIKLFCTGGLDTLLMYALLTKNSVPFELIDYEHYDNDIFTETNTAALNQYWGYTQIHHWTEPTVLATGSCGDEYLLRGPNTISLLTAWHDINLLDIIKNRPDAYHHKYFLKHAKVFEDAWNSREWLREQFPNFDLLKEHVYSMLANDHQHWHLGNTTTFTPFKNLDLVKTLLRVDVTELIEQFVDGKLSKDIIAGCDPKLVSLLSPYKNFDNKQVIPEIVSYHKAISTVDH
jgi:hypothetical protein